jgi:outer membrane receptor protein involved in Fe transport
LLVGAEARAQEEDAQHGSAAGAPAEQAEQGSDRSAEESSQPPPAERTKASEAAPESEPPGTAEEEAPLETIPVPAPPEQVPASADSTILDDVVVTAQKTSKMQLIRDVPISISVIDDKFIANWGVTDVREAMLFVPNVRVEAAGFFFSPRVRGFSVNNNNKAFEPPAGFALDGIPYTRVEYFNAAVFDIDRIEAMRGPQGTTFGKNTTAGLIHVISKNPTKEWISNVDLQGGDYDRRRVEAAVSGPLISDFLNVRVAGLYDEREGFITNTTAAVSPVALPIMRGQGREAVRAKLHFPDLLATSTILTYENSTLESRGVGAELYHITDRVKAFLERYDPNADTVRGNYVTSVDSPDGRTVEIETYGGESAFALGAWRLVALGGFSEMKNRLDVDADFAPAPALYLNDMDRSPTTTFELRAEPPDLGGLLGLQELFGMDLGYTSVLIGAFYQHREIRDGGFRFKLGQQAYLEFTAAAEEDDQFADMVALVPPEVQSSLFTGEPTHGPGDFGDDYEESHQRFDQWSDQMALFTQIQWNFHPDWFLQIGARGSQEDKRALWNSQYTSPNRPVLLEGAGIEEFTAERETQEAEIQPKVSLSYKPFDELSLFAHWARAYKGGGFNAFAYRPIDDQLLYDPELATDWGIDAKGSLFGGSAQYNVSLYLLDIDNFQVLTNEPDPLVLGLGVTKVENAAKARAQGVEADFTWRAASWMTLIGTAAVNDTEYLDFKINACPADRDGASGDGTRDADPRDRRCDATGKPFPYTPKYNYTLFTNLGLPVTAGGMVFSVGGGIEYMSMQFLDTDLDERKIQESFFRYRANVGIGNPHQRWSFKVVGENLTDERTSFRNNDLAAGVFTNMQEPARAIFGQLRYEFF